MSDNRSRILLTLLLTTVLALTVLPSTFSIPPTRSLVQGAVPTPGVSTYTEDFTTTTYRAGATTAAGWGSGAVTSPRDYTVTQLGNYSTPSPVYSIDVQGRKAYAVLYNPVSASQTLRIFDLTDPTNLKYLGYRSSSSLLRAGEVQGDVLYVGSSFLGSYCWLATYNVSNAYSIPAPLDSLTFPDGNITDLAVQGHFLYVAIHGSSGNDFTIVDVENPADIRTVGGSAFSDLYGLDVKGQLAYLADGIYGLYIHNVSNPYATTLVAWRDTPGNSNDVLVDGALAYVADGSAGVQVIDVHTPSSPTIIGSYDTPGQALRLALQGHTLFVADGAGGLQVVDVSNPSHPCSVTAVSLPYTYDVALYGGDVVVATASGVYTFRIAKGLAMLPIVGIYSGGYDFWDVRVQGDIAYVAAGPDGLLTFDVSDPANPVLLDQYSSGAVFYRKLDVQGHLAFVADYGSGFKVFDVSDPTNIKFADSRGLGYATDVCVAGEVAYIADGTSGVFIYNVSNPFNIPGPITSFTLGAANVTALWVQGYHLYVATQVSGGQGLAIYDIRDISSPTLVFGWNGVVTDHYDVFVDGDALYIADSLGYLVYWNVTDPFNAYYTDYIGSYEATGVWGFGPYMLATAYGSGTVLVNATDANNLAVLATCAGTTTALQVTVHGDYAYVANRSSLVILRLFRSAGATYVTGSSVAQSLTTDLTSELIVNATLNPVTFLPASTDITWQLSADGGAHWETITPGVVHTFTNTGSDLRWRATFTTGRDDQSAHLYMVSITYGYQAVTTLPPPIPGFPAAAIAVGATLSLGLVLVLRHRKQRKQ